VFMPLINAIADDSVVYYICYFHLKLLAFLFLLLDTQRRRARRDHARWLSSAQACTG
jgi:hypothetical protein